MNKKRMTVIVAILVALILLCFFACRKEETPTASTENDVVTQPATIEPTKDHEETIPGLADFDGDVNIDESTEPTIDKVEEEKDATEPTSSKDGEEEESAKPTDGKNEETEPTVEPTTGENEEEEATTPPTSSGNTKTEYEKFQAMSGAAQKEFMDSFGSVEEFFAWLNAARAEHEALHPEIDVGDGNINLGA